MTKDIYVEFLEYLGFNEEDIAQDYDAFVSMCNKNDISAEDVAWAKNEWIPSNFNAQYKGVRMGLGCLLRELIDVCQTDKFREEGYNIVYGILPAYSNLYYAMEAAAEEAGRKLYVGFPDAVLSLVLNGLFHKAARLYEIGENEFTPGCRHCPLNKTRLAAYSSGLIACPDVIWSWGFNCDEGPKTDEFIQELMGEEWKYVISRAPHDAPFGVFDDQFKRRLELVSNEYRLGFNTICDMINLEVTPEHHKKANNEIAKINFKIAQITNMMCQADPPIMSGANLTVFTLFQLFPLNRGMKKLSEALDVLLKELKTAVKNGEGILPKGSPKIGSYFCSPGVPWYDKLFLENGVCTTFSIITTVSKRQLNNEYFSDDPFDIMAEMWLRRGSIQNMGSDMDGMTERVETYKPDGMVMGFFDFDRYLGAHQKYASKVVSERTGVPFFYMESDYWDDRDYSEEAMRTRVESICQVLKMRKADEEDDD